MHVCSELQNKKGDGMAGVCGNLEPGPAELDTPEGDIMRFRILSPALGLYFLTCTMEPLLAGSQGRGQASEDPGAQWMLRERQSGQDDPMMVLKPASD